MSDSIRRWKPSSKRQRARGCSGPRLVSSPFMSPRSAAALVLTLAFVLTSGCSGRLVQGLHGVLVGEHANPVSPGQLFGGQFMQAHAPNSPGWVLLRESSTDITFARPGGSERESYVAMVSFFDLPATESKDAFVEHIRQGREADSSPDRFSNVQVTYTYSEERGYPCVAYVSSSLDVKAPGGALTLADRGIYCRHPKSQGLGFWVSYSQRSAATDPDFAEQASSFVEGVSVPVGQAAP